jgi:hypothetical protein
VEHPFEYRAHYNVQGDICHCPWGIAPGHEHLGSVKEASKLEWLENPEKRPEFHDTNHKEYGRNKAWLDYLRAFPNVEKFDKLLPWLHREYKKGHLLPSSSDSGHPYAQTLNYMPNGSPWNPELVTGDPGQHPWYTKQPYVGIPLNHNTLPELQDTLDEMKKRGKGLDLMQHKVHELMPKVEEFDDWKKAQERQDLGEVLHKFDDGWTVRRLQNAAEHHDEGHEMGHCIGGQGYSSETENGNRIYASLRDHKNLPHASIQLDPDHWEHKDTGEITHQYPGTPDKGWIPQIGPSSHTGEFYGKQDSAPEDEYVDRVNQWLAEHDAPYAEGGSGEADYLNVMAAHDFDSYNAIHGEDGEYYEYADETDDQGRPQGENTQYDFQEPEWGRIAHDFLENGPHPSRWNRTESDAQRLFNTAKYNHHLKDMNDALLDEAEPDNPNHQKQLKEWEKLVAPWYHPYTGILAPGGQNPPIDEYQKRMLQEVPEYRRSPQRIPVTEQEREQGYQGPMGRRPEGPEGSQWQYLTSKLDKPLYYRWIFSPSKGVTLGTNQDDHPALVDYHQNLGGQINDTDLVHGYAYPIGNGWRVTNYEHQPVGDPFIVNQVVRRLNLQAGPQIAAEGSWQPTEYDFDRLHYGLPREKTGTF